MTGYGTALVESKEVTVKVEIKSLNSKFLDLKTRLPGKYAEREIELQNIIEKYLNRGKIDMVMQVKNNDLSQLKKEINKDLFKAYFNEVKQLSSELGFNPDALAQSIMGLPDVFNNGLGENKITDSEWETITSTVELACKEVNTYRLKEGNELAKELLFNIKSIESNYSEVQNLKDKRSESISTRLQAKLEEINNGEYDKNRFEQEIIYYLEKLDITEELDRLRTHLNYFRDSITEEENGRKLNFVSQEIGREINTIGSKANDSTIQKLVVQMKSDLEKVKQQLANIL